MVARMMPRYTAALAVAGRRSRPARRKGDQQDREGAGRHLIEERLVHVVRAAGVLRDHGRHHHQQQAAGEDEPAGQPPDLLAAGGAVLCREQQQHARRGRWRSCPSASTMWGGLMILTSRP